MDTRSQDLRAALKKHFGYDAFRPHQEEIVRDFLSGRDVLALLPTGGGKSLCFQLPALISDGLTLVISPLIALMKDQVDALTTAGIPATFLNSTIDGVETYERCRGLETGEYKLLYVAPERLVMPGFFDELAQWGFSRLAVDEAHCVSEWGHDFRPEYRRIAEVRDHFPDVPMLALTATATRRVRQDIVGGLRLRDPRISIASFNRPNLIYRVEPKRETFQKLLAFVKEHPDESGIVYCQSRKTVEAVAAGLKDEGIAAAPYHAGLEADLRSSTQDRFIADEIQVVCATIAFGMGINKPDVRFVVHYDLPKNLEGYYQETGRAGRDGLPSDCLLYFSAGDAAKYRAFIEEKESEEERAVARRQLRQMVDYAGAGDCRRRLLLGYFGESFEELNCGACDNCSTPGETYDGTIHAQKLLSCVYRIRERDGWDMGVNHVVEVLTGADTEKVRSKGHQSLSTYGIGSDVPRDEWKAIARQLVQRGFLVESDDQFATIALTPLGRDVLVKRTPVILAKVRAAATADAVPFPSASERRKSKVGDIPCDEALFNRLRHLRKTIASERGVPPYIVFTDAALRDMARRFPTDQAAFAQVSGVGESKLRTFGVLFTSHIRSYIDETGQRAPGDPGRAKPPAAPREAQPAREKRAARSVDTVNETARLIHLGLTPDQVAAQRGLTAPTIWKHVEIALQRGAQIDLSHFITEADLGAANAAFDASDGTGVRAAFEAAEGALPYELLNIARALRERRATGGPQV